MMDVPNTIKAGQLAEQQACQFLQSKGLLFLVGNYRSRHGEIDLIMQDGDEIVFVEVRVRKNADYGDAIESVNFVKQKKIFNTAIQYLQKHNWLDKVDCRFDIIGITGLNGIEWVKDAFQMDNF